MTFGLYKSTQFLEHIIFWIPNQSAFLIIVPKFPGSFNESKAIDKLPNFLNEKLFDTFLQHRNHPYYFSIN